MEPDYTEGMAATTTDAAPGSLPWQIAQAERLSTELVEAAEALETRLRSVLVATDSPPNAGVFVSPTASSTHASNVDGDGDGLTGEQIQAMYDRGIATLLGTDPDELPDRHPDPAVYEVTLRPPMEVVLGLLPVPPTTVVVAGVDHAWVNEADDDLSLFGPDSSNAVAYFKGGTWSQYRRLPPVDE